MGALTSFQTIALIGAAVLLTITLAAAARHSIDWRTAFAWSALWVAAAVAILRPSLTIAVAQFLGIGRGADLVFYCGILAMLAGFFFVYVRIKRLEREITRLVRAIAIREAEERDGATR